MGGEDPLGKIVSGRAAPTVADLCDRFIDEYLPRKRASTQKGYRQQIEAEIRPALGRLKGPM
jgi:Phage integrase, N-terminal SAM-like domain